METGNGSGSSFFDPRARLAPEEPPHPISRANGVLALAGLGLLIGGQVGPWGWYVDSIGDRQRLAAWTQQLDGFLATVVALALVAVLAYRPIAGSGFRTVQYLPLLLGIVCLLSTVTGYREAATEAGHHRAASLEAGFDWGMWSTLIGGTLAAVAGFMTTLTWRRNPVHSDVGGVESRAEPAADVLVATLGAAAGLSSWLWLAGGGSGPEETAWLGVAATLCGPVAALSLWHRVRGALRR